MNKILDTIIVCAIMVPAIFCGCKKKDSATPSAPQTLLTKITDPNGAYTFQYDPQKRLSRIEYKYNSTNNAGHTIETMSYDNNNNMIKYTSGLDGTGDVLLYRDYSYNNRQVVSYLDHEYNFGAGGFDQRERAAYSYSADGKIITEVIDTSTDKGATWRTRSTSIFTLDGANNIVKKEVTEGKIHTIITYQYDQKKNIYTFLSNVSLPVDFRLPLGTNNVISSSEQDSDMGGPINSWYEYKYRDDGYPSYLDYSYKAHYEEKASNETYEYSH